jgi:hypothetical protein
MTKLKEAPPTNHIPFLKEDTCLSPSAQGEGPHETTIETMVMVSQVYIVSEPWLLHFKYFQVFVSKLCFHTAVRKYWCRAGGEVKL